MSNLVRYRSVDDMFDDLMRGFLVKPLLPVEGRELQIRMDVKEKDNAYMVRADIPGVKKEDIHVEVDGNRVTIRAEVKREKEEKEGEKLLRMERYSGTVARTFELPYDVDLAEANAKYENGVLDLVLPKRASAKAKSIAVA